MIYWLTQLFCRHSPRRLMILHRSQQLFCPDCGKKWTLAAEVCVTHDVGLVMYDRSKKAKESRRAKCA